MPRDHYRQQSPQPPRPQHAREPSPAAGRLRKPVPAPSHSRSTSGQYLAPSDYAQPTLPNLQPPDGNYQLLPPPPIAAVGSGSRASSLDRSSRPDTPNYSRPSTPTMRFPGERPLTPSSPGAAEKQKRKTSWFGGKKKEEEPQGPAAWIAGHPKKEPYDREVLRSGRPVRELWDDEDGNCYVYLFPKSSGRPASFKVDSGIFASSPVLTKLAFGDVYSQQPDADRRQLPLDARTRDLSLDNLHTPPATPGTQRNGESNSVSSRGSKRSRYSNFSESTQEAHLYLPIKLGADVPQAPAGKGKKGDAPYTAAEDLQTLVDIRNFFAFLCGQSLIATDSKGSLFQIFMSMAGILKTYEFSNFDGSTYGEIANSSFDSYVEELGLADVRHSRDKTIEGVVLGERMKSVLLYNEAFTHAVGKYDELLSMKSPKFNLLSSITQNRLGRAAMDLEKRVQNIRLTLNDFYFPSLFSGIMNSKMSEERKEGVRFDEWKDAFLGTRKWCINTYQHRYGHWPPKARSSKNELETSGLNRLVLRDLYNDMRNLYDLLVDRTNLTTRTVDGINLEERASEQPTIRALRAVLSEYDRSSPPVKPPIPFDLPRIPDLKTTRSDFNQGDAKKDAKALDKKIKPEELAKLLKYSSNDDVAPTPFLDAFRELEKKAAHGGKMVDIADLRIGQWIFMYVVLQALPMLACDAPGIKHTKGVEYFLCEPPRSGVPWAQPAAGAQGGFGGGLGGRRWFSVGEGGGVVSLPSDVVEHGVEGIYRRSHCWQMAERWSAANPILNSALHEQEAINASQSAALGNDAQSSSQSQSHSSGGGGGNARASLASNSTYPHHPTPPPQQYQQQQQQQHQQYQQYQQYQQPFPPPPRPNSFLAPGSRSSSPANSLRADHLGGNTSKRHSYMGLGLEALPLPAGVSPDGRSSSPGYGRRPVSQGGYEHVVDSTKTFDAILGQQAGKKGKGKK